MRQRTRLGLPKRQGWKQLHTFRNAPRLCADPSVEMEEAAGTFLPGVDDAAKEMAWSETTVRFVENHAEAAELAFARRSPVFLTTGSRNFALYAEAARRTGTSLGVRVLNTPESLAACREAGIPREMIIAGRSPLLKIA